MCSTSVKQPVRHSTHCTSLSWKCIFLILWVADSSAKKVSYSRQEKCFKHEVIFMALSRPSDSATFTHLVYGCLWARTAFLWCSWDTVNQTAGRRPVWRISVGDLCPTPWDLLKPFPWCWPELCYSHAYAHPYTQPGLSELSWPWTYEWMLRLCSQVANTELWQTLAVTTRTALLFLK